MRSPQGVWTGLLTASLLWATIGCQSAGRQATLAETTGPTPAPASSPVDTANSSPKSAPGKSAVRLTGFTADETEEPEQPAAARQPRGNTAAVHRDVQPIFSGRGGISDPNAGADEADQLNREAQSQVEPASHQRAKLFGDDPEKLFREQETPPLQTGPGLTPGPDNEEPASLPPLIPPEPEAASPYDQALNTPVERITFKQDLQQVLPILWDDGKSLFTWQNAAIMTVAAGGAVAIRESGLDDHVRDSARRHEERWGEGSDVLRQFGEPKWQVPVLASFYAYTLWKQDPELHDYSCALIDGYSISALTTVALKGICDTQRPTDQFMNGKWGFPSFHTSSIFAIGGVTEEYYGWEAGLPIYVLGGLVGWSRIDQREHDLSDVLFGAVLGYVVGKTVGANHFQKTSEKRWNVEPYYDPLNSASGLTLQTSF